MGSNKRLEVSAEQRCCSVPSSLRSSAPPQPGRYVHSAVRAVVLALTVSAALAADPDSGDGWSLTFGRWGPAPLHMDDITINEHTATFGDCDLAVRREARFETIRYEGFERTDTYDAFLFRLSAAPGGKPCRKGLNYMLVEIPKVYRCHARISFYRDSTDLPSEEERLDAKRLFKGTIAGSAGYGLRSRDRVCLPESKR